VANNTNTRKAIFIRSMIVFSGMLLFAGWILYTLIHIQFVEGDKWRKMSEEFTIREFDIEPIRGNIFDCKGNLLATSVPIYDIVIDAKTPGFANTDTFERYVDSLAIQLANLFKDKSVDSYKQQLTKLKLAGKRYNIFKKNISYRQMRAMSKFPIFRKGRNKGGFIAVSKSRREKPFDLLAERTLGFSRAGVRSVGIEFAFDSILRGKSGKQLLQRIAGNSWIPLEDESLIEAQQGKDLITTIDINLQDVSEHALMNTLIDNDAEYGTAILMEVSTGEIKAIANLTRVSEGVYQERYNYAVGNQVAPGSTFKLVSMMALLNDGFVTPTDNVDVEGGEKRFCSATMKDSHLGAGVMSMQYAFEHSSNVAFAKQMNAHYARSPKQLYAFYKSLGLTQKLDIQIKGAAQPKVKSPDSKAWSCTSLPWMAIGYELEISPLQLLTVYNAVANNGVMVSPLFVKSIMSEGKKVQSYTTNIINAQVCKPEVIKQLQNMLEGVVLRGTASKLKSDHYTYAGKTGTAVIDKKGVSQEGKSYRASFCGYFPAENPKYSCLVLISKPAKNKYYAAEVALPVFKEIADKVYASALSLHQELKFAVRQTTEDLPKVPKADKDHVQTILNTVSLSSHFHNDSIHQDQTDWVRGVPQDKSMALEPILAESGGVPNVVGMGVRDAVYLLEKKGLRVEIKGVGKVKKQSIAPGTNSKKYKTIQIELS
jgi:cell division protein FtsI (penicillin-binding protein 3)